MRCAQVQEHSEQYREGQVSSAVRARIDAHLKSCEAYRTAYEGMVATAAMFAQAAAPAVPEGMLDTVYEKVRRRSACDTRNREEALPLTGWWAMATPGVRVAYSLVLAVLVAGGLHMGGDLWKSKSVPDVAVSNEDDFPGIDAFLAIQPGSIEQAYFVLTSDGGEGSGR